MLPTLLLALLLQPAATEPDWGSIAPSIRDATPLVTERLAQLVDEDAETRDATADALLRMGPPAAGALAKLAIRASLPERKAISDLLPRFGPESIPYLVNGDAELVRMAIVQMGESALGPLEGLFQTRYGRSLAQGSLRRMGPEQALPVLERLMKSSDEGTRTDALNVVASWRDPLVAEVLLSQVHSTDAWSRRQAIHGLGRLRDARVIPGALDSVVDDPSWAVQEVSVLALAGQYERRFLGPMSQASRWAPQVMVRRSAASSLRAVSDPVANALGRRYEVASVDPAAVSRAWIRYRYMLASTALVIYGFMLLGAKTRARGTAAVVALVAVGYVWGARVTHVEGVVERSLLLVVIPAVWLVARFIGLTATALRAVSLPLLMALGAGVVSAILGQILGVLTIFGPAILALVAPLLVSTGFLVGLALAGRRMAQIRKSGSADRELKALATLGCLGFYFGYVLGWWQLWGFSDQAFRNFL